MPEASDWSTFGTSVVVPLGFLIGILTALVLWVLYTRMRFGFEVGVIADSPRAARYAGMRTRRKILAVMALSGAIAGIGGASQIGDFTHTLDGSPTGSAGGGVRLHGHRRRGAGALQPVRGLPRRGAHRRAAERRLHAAGPGLPVGPRGRDAGNHPLLRTGWRAAPSLPGADHSQCGPGSRSRRPGCERQRQPARDRARAGGALRDAAPVRGARGAPRRALGSPQSRRPGDDALRSRGRLLGHAAGRRLRAGGAVPGRRRLGARGRRRWLRSTRSW